MLVVAILTTGMALRVFHECCQSICGHFV